MTPLELAAGNPGALVVLMALRAGHDSKSVVAMDDLGFRGSDIWVAYKDFAGEDLAKLTTALACRDPEMIAMVERERAR